MKRLLLACLCVLCLGAWGALEAMEKVLDEAEQDPAEWLRRQAHFGHPFEHAHDLAEALRDPRLRAGLIHGNRAKKRPGRTPAFHSQ